MDEERVVCETPTPGKKLTRIHKWKYDLLGAPYLRLSRRAWMA